MKPKRSAQSLGLLALLLGGTQAHGQVVRYRSVDGSSPKLWTAAQVDTFRQVMNRRGRPAGIAFEVVIRRTITRPDTVIQEYSLLGTHTPAALQARQQGLDGFIGQPLPAFALPDVQGKLVDSHHLLGKPVVLNLWFTTCGPCIAEMPTLNRIQREKAATGIVFLAMTFDNSEKVRAFLHKQPFTYRQLAGAQQYCSQFATGYPVTFFVGRDGLIKKVLGGLAVATNPHTQPPSSADDQAFYAALKQIE
ncbi:TlpA family protein disulfide reductase [Hymenobacter sp. UV11]|uniref:TlpA family protein disulfide reductase n=1 Tax=Hymenobacter sp. UV11 TaxID=1849735 RepID=UPI00105BBFEF|nr:TlpA disulfide reductase family protein [Hymenobacter sp. UV11]TFZ63058.1 TlpA family protein disulfide reductase [Hymenobacter sp. UV11]